MGQQQILLIVLGVIVVGLAIAVGLTMFQDYMIDQKRDLLVKECIRLSGLAHEYYRRPTTLGGGGQSFTGWQIDPEIVKTSTSRYSTKVEAQQVEIVGTGDILVNGTDSLKVQMIVQPDDFTITPLN